MNEDYCRDGQRRQQRQVLPGQHDAGHPASLEQHEIHQ
jgi:hypothetical protein